jgi:hypothetical protein
MGNFHSSNDIGSKSENQFKQEYLLPWMEAGHIDKVWHVPHTEFRKRGYKYDWDFVVKIDVLGACEQRNIEMKSLAGGYPTGVVEKWKYDDRTGRAGWYLATEKGLLDYVIVHDRSVNKFYLFDAQLLKQHVDNTSQWEERQCYDKNTDAMGWVVKFRWTDKDAGYICTLDPEVYSL